MKIKYLAICCAAIAGLSVTIPVMAQTATASGSMQVQIAITANCAVTGTSTTLDFGSQVSTATGPASANNGGFSVSCTNGTQYKVGLKPVSTDSNDGVGKMSADPDNGEFIEYTLYQDSASTVWGNDVNTNVKSGTGNGQVQAHTVYGKTTSTLNVAAATYRDTVAINVYY
ncbi:spore coat protein U domain-containing protein [Alcaligenaceae bacterium]|nr:spore coat protein U domain-containing protein [Alcaligenaceae bacterium]